MDDDREEGNYTTQKFPSGVDYSLEVNNHHHHQQELMMNAQATIGSTSGNNQMVDYMLNNDPSPSPLGSNSFDKLISFADVMQFADFGPKLALNQSKSSKDETAIDPIYFLKFPVLNDAQKLQEHDDGSHQHHLQFQFQERGDKAEDNNTSAAVQLKFLSENVEKNPSTTEATKSKRKRPRSVKTSEEVESQRMTHIAVERNRRKQMNEHLRVLRSLMPSSYVQRGDQASIIGGAIEFVRELEQLLQCLESQKRRRLYGDGPRPAGDPSMPGQQQPNTNQALMFPQMGNSTVSTDQPGNNLVELEHQMGLREDVAESKSCLADVEVKLLGFDALIKILSRRRPGQLIKTVAALEDLQLNILHTNITTIEQTVLYSFNVKELRTSFGRKGAKTEQNSAKKGETALGHGQTHYASRP